MQLLDAFHDALSTFNLGQVVSAATAATVGALVGVAGTAHVSSRARRYEATQATAARRYEAAQAAAASLDRAIENLFRSLVNLAASTAAWEQAVRRPGSCPASRGG